MWVDLQPVAAEKEKGKEKAGSKRKPEQVTSQPAAKKAKKESQVISIKFEFVFVLHVGWTV